MGWKRNRVLVYRKEPVPDSRREDGGSLTEVRTYLEAPPEQIRVGIWDLDASTGAMPTLLDRLDECQRRFSFSAVEAPFPTGLTRPGMGAAEDWFRHTNRPMDARYAKLNVAARPIYEVATPVLQKMPIEWLVVAVKAMISDTTDPQSCWYNLFSTSSKRVVLVSTYEVREFAAKASRSFEAAVFGVALSALLAAMIPDIEYQKESTGSIFDFAENRSDIVKAIRNPSIDPRNRERIPADLLPAVDAMIEVLRAYKGGPALGKARTPVRKQKPVAVKRTGVEDRPAARRSLGFAQANKKSVVGKTAASPNAASAFLGALKSLDATLLKLSASEAPGKGKTRSKRSKTKKT